MNKQLNIGHLSTAYHTNFVLMANDDLKKDLQKEIVWILFGTGPLMVDAFRKNQLDAGYMGLPPAIIGIAHGIPIKCVAGGHVNGTIMVAKKKYLELSQFKNNMYELLAQFKGKTIGTPSKGSIHDAILNYYLSKNHLLDQIEVKNYKQAEFIALDIKRGLLEAGVGTPSLAVFTSTILDSHIIIPASDLLPYNPSYGIFFHQHIIDNHPEIIVNFLNHHKEASKLLRDSPEKAAERIMRTYPIINKSFIKSVLEISPNYCISLSEEYINSTKNFMNTMLKLGYINKRLNTKEIFSFEFIKEVHPEKDHYYLV